MLERAGTGDLLSRITTDIDRLANAMREAVPQLAIGVVWAALLLGALGVTAPPLALAVLIALPVLVVGCRWYFRRAPSAYRSEAAGYAAVAAALTETVDAGRTVEAHRLGARRIALSDQRVKEWTAWERYTLWLRSVLFPVVSVTHMTIMLSVLMIGGVFVLHGWITVGELTTGALFAQMLVEPVGLILRWYDELQVAQVSLGRLVGVREIEPAAGDAGVRPDGRDVEADAVRFGYREGVDVLHEVSLSVAPGTRLALVGPSGAGKSTLGRLLAGIYAPRDGPRHPRRGRAVADAGGTGARACGAGQPGAPRLRGLAARQPAARAHGRRGRRAVGGARRGRRGRLGAGSGRRASTRRSARAASRSPRPRPSRSRWPGWSWRTRTRWSWTRRPRCWTRGRPAIWSAHWPAYWTAVRSWRSPTGCTPRTTRT